VGHETDFTIADFVADLRASTPSAAVELVIQSRQEFDRHLAEQRHKVAQWTRYRLSQLRHRLRDLVAHRGFRRLEDLLRRRRQRTDELAAQLAEGLRARLDRLRRRFTLARTRLVSVDLRARLRAFALRLEQRSAGLGARVERVLVAKRRRLETLRLQLEERNPLRVLERGYAVCYDAAGNVVQSADAVALGDRVRVQLSRGRLTAEVKEKDAGQS
jgi:exodeoxyribonuclease VII large subunit